MADISTEALLTTISNKADKDFGNCSSAALVFLREKLFSLDTKNTIVRDVSRGLATASVTGSFGTAPFNGFAFTLYGPYNNNTFVFWEKIDALWYPLVQINSSTYPNAQFPITKGREYTLTVQVSLQEILNTIGVGVATPIGNNHINPDKYLMMTPFFGELD